MLPVAEKVPEAAASAGLAAAAPASRDPAAITAAIIFLTADHLLRLRSAADARVLADAVRAPGRRQRARRIGIGMSRAAGCGQLFSAR